LLIDLHLYPSKGITDVGSSGHGRKAVLEPVSTTVPAVLCILSETLHQNPRARAALPEQLSQSRLSPTALTPDRHVPLNESAEDEVKAKRKHVIFRFVPNCSQHILLNGGVDVPTVITPREVAQHDRGWF
jgi:hypothetical protein